MTTTTTIHTGEWFTVTVDPMGARSIIADYANYDEAEARFDREVSRLRDHGGTAYIFGARGVELKHRQVRAEIVELGHKGRSWTGR